MSPDPSIRTQTATTRIAVEQADRRPAGLTAAEAARRLLLDGPNVLPPVPPPPVWRLILAQLVHFFALMLWVAGALAILAGMPQLGVAIFAVIVINGLFAFLQEYRAERAAERLRDLLPRRATVVRDGVPVEIDARELVVEDLVVLAPGDRISADLRAVEAHALSIDTSTLTGESVPVAAQADDALFAGTYVTEGEGLALVTTTGSATRLAGIASLTRAGHRPRSPLARELDRVVRTVASSAVAVGACFFVLALLLGFGATDGFLFAIGVTVALVPEGLLPTVTLSLALGAQRMAGRHALVRRLESVETLGSTTFICTDKTGTLTRNEMSVVAAWTPAGIATIRGEGYEPHGTIEADQPTREALDRLARAARLCSNGRIVEVEGHWTAQGDPMEAAIDALTRRLGQDVDAGPHTGRVTRRYPFDAVRRRMSIVVDGELLVKGAPDSVLPRCRDVDTAPAALDELAARGLRVIAVAARPIEDEPDGNADLVERDLELLGLLGLEDPPRPAAKPAIAACHRAGIRVAMVTGDHPATAAAIAREVGLCGDEPTVIEGRDLPADEDELGTLLDHDGIVVARVAPEDKLRIARALRRRGHVVAMTGDGVNDGPALQEADIGIAMGRSGTDVAREAADLVLLDDDFATIVVAVRQGRATFANLRRFLTYHLTDNVAELAPFAVWALSGGRFPLALGVLQILCLDLGTDMLPALALGAEPPAPHTLEQPPPRQRLMTRDVLQRAFMLLGPVEATVELAAFTATFLAAGWRPGDDFPGGTTLLAASGAAFAAVVVGQIANAFACRSTTRPAWKLSLGSNRLLLAAIAAEAVALFAFLFIPWVADLLEQSRPTVAGWTVALLAAPAVLIADGIYKLARARRHAGSTDED